MKPMQTKRHGARLKMLWITSLLGAAALVAGCGGGGGGDSASVGSGGTGGAFSGPISGFGSVIVNGIRFDDSAATVTIDDDGGPASALKLGMMVEIEGSKNDDGIRGTANAIHAGSQVKGPISAKTGTTLTVLGMTVIVNANTAFEDVAGFANLNVNDVVEVHAINNGQCTLLATRIEKESSATPGTPIDVRITGTIKGITATSFTLDNACTTSPTVNVLAATRIDNLSLLDGTLVRVKGTIPTVDSLIISATRIKARKQHQEGGRVEVEGIVSDFTNLATNFKISGQIVDASKATEIKGTFANGARAEAEGTIVGGKLVATKVEAKNEGLEAEFEVHGTIANFIDSSQAFTLLIGTGTGARTVQVRLIGTPTIVLPLTAATLTNNVKVEVKGNVVGDIVQVTRIKIDS